MKNICEWKNCKETGKFKAPTESDNSKKFKLLCDLHIKEFNLTTKVGFLHEQK